jgi:hypothetical protein
MAPSQAPSVVPSQAPSVVPSQAPTGSDRLLARCRRRRPAWREGGREGGRGGRLTTAAAGGSLASGGGTHACSARRTVRFDSRLRAAAAAAAPRTSSKLCTVNSPLTLHPSPAVSQRRGRMGVRAGDELTRPSRDARATHLTRLLPVPGATRTLRTCGRFSIAQGTILCRPPCQTRAVRFATSTSQCFNGAPDRGYEAARGVELHAHHGRGGACHLPQRLLGDGGRRRPPASEPRDPALLLPPLP